MDLWKFFDVTHREHRICNPTNEEKLSRLVSLLRLPPRSRVLDIACGKAEFLIRLAEAYDVAGVGVDLSPFFLDEARKNCAARAPRADLTLRHMDGKDVKREDFPPFRMASCLGASWIFGGHRGTLEALASFVEPDGWVIAGEPYWIQEPSAEYLELSGCKRGDFGTHDENAAAGRPLGLDLVHTIVSSHDDWDTYEGLQWLAADRYARAHRDDPDLPELADRVAKGKEAYLRWGRDVLGWAVYVFRRG